MNTGSQVRLGRASERGTRIRLLRKAAGMTTADLGVRIDRTAGYISLVERGHCNLGIETECRLAELFHVSLDYLEFGDDKAGHSRKIHELLTEIDFLRDQIAWHNKVGSLVRDTLGSLLEGIARRPDPASGQQRLTTNTPSATECRHHVP